MSKQEYEGVAWSPMVDQNGCVINVTERAESSLDAYKNLTGTLAVMTDEGCTPFWSYTNKYALKSVLDVGKELGGIEAAVPTEKMIEGAFPKESTTLEDGTNYLGMKKFMKAGDVVAGDSFEVVVSTYSFDGKTIEFFNDGEYSVASHKMTGTWLETFNKIFNDWQPKQGEKISLGGDLILYIVCSGAKSTGNPYQNIKGQRLKD